MSIRRRHLIGVHVVTLSLLITLAPGTPASDMIYTGGKLIDGNTLVSAGGSFTLGFFSPPGEPTKRYLGTWFSFSAPTPDATAIYWVANRDRPLAGTCGTATSGTCPRGAPPPTPAREATATSPSSAAARRRT